MIEIASSMLKQANLACSRTMIDVGCGAGQTMAWFTSSRPGWNAAGLDIAEDGVAAAKSAGLAVVTGNALELPCESSSADLVITLDVLQHLPLPAGDVDCLREIRR